MGVQLDQSTMCNSIRLYHTDLQQHTSATNIYLPEHEHEGIYLYKPKGTKRVRQCLLFVYYRVGAALSDHSKTLGTNI